MDELNKLKDFIQGMLEEAENTRVKCLFEITKEPSMYNQVSFYQVVDKMEILQTILDEINKIKEA